ncbi:hypothetical protein BLOT_010195, partial [Blomia tropicalis]
MKHQTIYLIFISMIFVQSSNGDHILPYGTRLSSLSLKSTNNAKTKLELIRTIKQLKQISSTNTTKTENSSSILIKPIIKSSMKPTIISIKDRNRTIDLEHRSNGELVSSSENRIIIGPLVHHGNKPIQILDRHNPPLVDSMTALSHSYSLPPLTAALPMRIPGLAWKDYPVFTTVPRTSFSCARTSYGYYADIETGCQVWHYCQPDGRHNSFLCPNGTVFNQATRVCDW